jgi:hypothetical protein
MKHRIRSVRIVWVAISVLLGVLATAVVVYGFAEEPLGFRDPYTGVTYPAPPQVSTVHDDLTYLLALASGFSITDSRTLRLWNQLTDSEAITGSVVYSNGGGAFYTPPDADVVCGLRPHSAVIWPRWDDVTISTSITSRFGPYSPYFHFPHQNARDLGALRDWATGVTNTLVAYEAYAWGGPADLTVMRAACLYTRTAVITTSMQAGSLEAFATYLHSLADSYSHLDCIDAMDARGMPWATHTTPPLDDSIPACDYHPSNPQSDDVHGEEFFTYTASLRTDAAIRAVYMELVTRSLQREGQYFPIGLNTPISGGQTLSDTLAVFVHQWTFDQAGERRAYVDELAAAVLAQRREMRQLYLPLIRR